MVRVALTPRPLTQVGGPPQCRAAKGLRSVSSRHVEIARFVLAPWASIPGLGSLAELWGPFVCPSPDRQVSGICRDCLLLSSSCTWCVTEILGACWPWTSRENHPLSSAPWQACSAPSVGPELSLPQPLDPQVQHL